jgi:hypothetical protein
MLVCSGSGMTADCKVTAPENSRPMVLTNGLADPSAQIKIPILRGTYGLWQHFPFFKEHRILFE